MDASVGLAAALAVEGRCKPTGGWLICNGHFDYFGSYLVWTYHVATRKTVLYRVIPYDHPAPEVIHARALPRQ